MNNEHKLISVEKITNNKFLNYYKLRYKNGGKELEYCIASRRQTEKLSVNNPTKDVADAVRVIPYFYKNNKMYVVLIKEFRYPINGYIYGVPAGLVDEGETELRSAVREIKEEIGAKVLKIKRTTKPCFSSAGMTDESISCFEAEVELGANQELGYGEDIKVVICPFEKLPSALKTKRFGMQSRLQLEAFYYKHKLEELTKE